MSSTGKTRSKENKAAELEPDESSELELERTIDHLEPETERTAEVGSLHETEDYSQVYGPKNVTKKALTAMGCASLAIGSVTAATMGLGGALALDYYGKDQTYSVEKVEKIYRQVEDYLEKVDL